MHNKNVQCDQCENVWQSCNTKTPHIDEINSKNNGALAVRLPFPGGRKIEDEEFQPSNEERGIFDFCDVECLAEFLKNPVTKERGAKPSLPAGTAFIKHDGRETYDFRAAKANPNHRTATESIANFHGLGLHWQHNGDHCRTAVLIPLNPTADDVLEAWDLLARAVASPTAETCVFGEEPITGREQRVTSMKNMPA